MHILIDGKNNFWRRGSNIINVLVNLQLLWWMVCRWLSTYFTVHNNQKIDI